MEKFDKRNEIKVISTMNFQEKIAQSDLQEHSNDLSELLSKLSNSLKPYRVKMVATSSKVKQGSDMLVHGVELKAPDFKLTPVIPKTLDPSGAQSQIPSKILLINNNHSHFKCAIQDISTLEMDECLKELCFVLGLKIVFPILSTIEKIRPINAF